MISKKELAYAGSFFLQFFVDDNNTLSEIRYNSKNLPLTKVLKKEK